MLHFENRNHFRKYISQFSDPVKQKNDFLLNLCRGKRVLDIGCIDHSYETAKNLGDNWLHKRIKKVALELTGMDLLDDAAQKLNQDGYNIISGNAENFNLSKTYEVIIAGDLIEHLSNIGSFLQSVKKHMNKESIFVFTTPNPFNIEQFMTIIFDNKINVNLQHTVWIDPDVCWELVTRENLIIKDFFWLNTIYKFPVSRPYFRKCANFISKFLLRKRYLLGSDYAIICSL